MKTSYWITFGICLLAIIVIGGEWLGVLPNFNFSSVQSVYYQDPYAGFSFRYPEDLIIRDISHPNEKIQILNVMPKAIGDKFDPQFMEIISYGMPEDTFENSIADFLSDIDEKNLISSERDGLKIAEYSQIKGVGEQSLYTFISNGEKMVVLIFRMRGFDKANPLVLVDNSRYLSSYKHIVSTFNFN